MVVFQWVRCTVHGTYKLFFSTKLSLKMSLIVLFTHLKIICYTVFNFYQNKRYPNGPLIGVKIDLVPIWIQLSHICVFVFFWKHVSVAVVVFQWVLCTIHETHKLLFSTKLSLKIGPMALFTHLKNILLQYF